MSGTTAGFPNNNVPIVESDGRASREFWRLLLAIFNRTGGDGTPVDLATLENLSFILAEASTAVPNASVLKSGTGISLTISSGDATISLEIPVTVGEGGTGVETIAQHSVLVGNGNNAINTAGPGTAGLALLANGPTADPTFQAIVNAIAAGTGLSISSPTGTVTISLQTPVPVTEGGTGVSTLTPNGVLVGNGGGPVGALATGTAGQVLTSNGLGTNPSMQAIPSQAGRLLSIRPLVSGTYTPTAGTNSVLFKLQAAGGGGGGTVATAAGQSAAGSGGSAGAYAEAYFTAGFSGVTVTLGAAGAGVSGANGTAGATSSIGSLISCPGGPGGAVSSAMSAPGFTGGSGPSSSPTVSGAAETLVTLAGAGGLAGVVYTAGTLSQSGQGANALLGIGGNPKPGTGSNAGDGFGSGGGGANAGASAAAQTGAAGQPAYCEVWEFA
jgi:hypothetical protein